MWTACSTSPVQCRSGWSSRWPSVSPVIVHHGLACTDLAVKKETYACLLSVSALASYKCFPNLAFLGKFLVSPPTCLFKLLGGHGGSQVYEVPGRSINASRSRSAMELPPVCTGGVAAAPALSLQAISDKAQAFGLPNSPVPVHPSEPSCDQLSVVLG